MTNIAQTWPALQGIDLTSPAEIEQMARAIADLPNREARRPLVEKYRANHSDHVCNLIRRQAKILINRRKYG